MFARYQDQDMEDSERRQAMEEEISDMGLASDFARIMVLNEEQYPARKRAG